MDKLGDWHGSGEGQARDRSPNSDDFEGKSMRKISLTVLAVFTAALSAFMSTCKDAGEPVQVEEGGPGIIVPGVGMEGVKLGDSKETVEAKLGSHSSNCGYVDGTFRSWLGCEYLNGPHGGLSILFLENDDGSFGPVDNISTTTYSGTPYSGKTKEGIGVGSRLAMVRQAYGLPDTTLQNISWPNGYIVDRYCIGNKQLEIAYQDSVIFGLNIGYFLPIPDNHPHPCK